MSIFFQALPASRPALNSRFHVRLNKENRTARRRCEPLRHTVEISHGKFDVTNLGVLDSNPGRVRRPARRSTAAGVIQGSGSLMSVPKAAKTLVNIANRSLRKSVSDFDQ